MQSPAGSSLAADSKGWPHPVHRQRMVIRKHSRHTDQHSSDDGEQLDTEHETSRNTSQHRIERQHRFDRSKPHRAADGDKQHALTCDDRRSKSPDCGLRAWTRRIRPHPAHESATSCRCAWNDIRIESGLPVHQQTVPCSRWRKRSAADRGQSCTRACAYDASTCHCDTDQTCDQPRCHSANQGRRAQDPTVNTTSDCTGSHSARDAQNGGNAALRRLASCQG